MDRMAQHTKQPEVLRELFEALGNDPFVIAECLARADARGAKLATVAPVKQSWVAKPETQVPITMAAVTANYTLPAIATPSGGCIDDTWTPTSLTNAPDARERSHGSVDRQRNDRLGDGVGAPSISTLAGDTTPAPTVGQRRAPSMRPTGRAVHTAVWTGSEMIVWGGSRLDGSSNTGGRYNPSTDSWIATTTSQRARCPIRFTRQSGRGSEMIVWGGTIAAGTEFAPAEGIIQAPIVGQPPPLPTRPMPEPLTRQSGPAVK